MTNENLDLFDRVVKLMGQDPLMISSQKKYLLGIAGIALLMAILFLEYYWISPLVSSKAVKEDASLMFAQIYRIIAFNAGTIISLFILRKLFEK